MRKAWVISGQWAKVHCFLLQFTTILRSVLISVNHHLVPSGPLIPAAPSSAGLVAPSLIYFPFNNISCPIGEIHSTFIMTQGWHICPSPAWSCIKVSHKHLFILTIHFKLFWGGPKPFPAVFSLSSSLTTWSWYSVGLDSLNAKFNSQLHVFLPYGSCLLPHIAQISSAHHICAPFSFYSFMLLLTVFYVAITSACRGSADVSLNALICLTILCSLHHHAYRSS